MANNVICLAGLTRPIADPELFEGLWKLKLALIAAIRSLPLKATFLDVRLGYSSYGHVMF